MKDQILKLRSEGKSYNEICKALSCSKGTVSYHCGEGQKEKSKQRQQNNRSAVVLYKKISRFQHRSCLVDTNPIKSNGKKLLRHKADDFQRERSDGKLGVRSIKFGYQDVLEHFGKQTKCYLTGRTIDLAEPRTYNFDHIIPVSQQGTNNFDNLGIACKEANEAKSGMTVNEFFGLCKDVLEYNGYNVTKHGDDPA